MLYITCFYTQAILFHIIIYVVTIFYIVFKLKICELLCVAEKKNIFMHIYIHGLSSIRIKCCILFHIDSAYIRHIQFLLDTYMHIHVYIYIFIYSYTVIYITDYITFMCYIYMYFYLVLYI